MPDGWYNLSENEVEQVSKWVKAGGKLIAMAGALNILNDKKGFALSEFATKEEKEASEKEASQKELKARNDSYEDAERRSISGSIPGAIFENTIDMGHPLCFGLGPKYYSIKSGIQKYSLLKNAWNPIYVKSGYKSMGFVGQQVKALFNDSMTFAIEENGKGNVIYMVDNPLFRGFWENGNLLFTNALFLIN
jgi:hypothetical protein